MRIKVSTHELRGSPFIIQTPGMAGRWDDAEFFINDRNCVDCDHWIVMEEVKTEEECVCSPDNVWFIMEEPKDINVYGQDFLNQFANVITSQDIEGSFKVFHEQQSIRWFYGWDAINSRYSETYDSLSKEEFPSKTKLISLISSTKKFCPGHLKRIDFAKKAGRLLGADVYGWGLKDFACKKDVIKPYKYHVVIENSYEDDYWTEKLSDCYLGWAFPIYCGCTNIEKYFDENSFFCVDISDPVIASKKIMDFIKSHDYEASKPFIRESRERVLNEYNFFPNAVRLCKNNDSKTAKITVKLRPQNSFVQLVQADEKNKTLEAIKGFFEKVAPKSCESISIMKNKLDLFIKSKISRKKKQDKDQDYLSSWEE